VTGVDDHGLMRLVQARGFGSRARGLREDEGVSLRRVAARARITPTHLMNVERGDVMPSLAIAERIANAVNADVGELLSEPEVTGEGRTP
jgi:transcriptional regulator with XRE-family HTH domain